MTVTEVLLSSGIVALAAFTQGAVGFAFAIITAPFLLLILPWAVPGTVIILAIPVTVFVGIRERRAINLAEVGWIVLGLIPGSVVGAMFVRTISGRTLDIVLASLVLIAVAVSWSGVRVPMTRATQAVVGLSSGVMGTVSSIGGPPLALLYRHHAAGHLRATLSWVFAVAGVIAVVALSVAGALTSRQVALAVALLPATVVGLAASTVVARFLRPEGVRAAVLILCVVAAGGVLIRAVAN